MIKIKNKRLLDANEDILVQQVSASGTMRGVNDLEINRKYPRSHSEYNKICKDNSYDYSKMKGKVDLTKESGKYIAKIFSQDENGNTDYKALRRGLRLLRKYAEQEKLSVAIPFKIGCEKGNWNDIIDIVNQEFKDYTVILYK